MADEPNGRNGRRSLAEKILLAVLTALWAGLMVFFARLDGATRQVSEDIVAIRGDLSQMRSDIGAIKSERRTEATEAREENRDRLKALEDRARPQDRPLSAPPPTFEEPR